MIGSSFRLRVSSLPLSTQCAIWRERCSSLFKIYLKTNPVTTIAHLNCCRSLTSCSATRWSNVGTNSSSLSANPTPEELDEENSTGKPFVVYDGVLKGQLKRVKLISLTSSAMGAALQPQIIMNAGEHSMLATGAFLVTVGFFTYVTPILIHLLAKRYVTEIIFDPSSSVYTAVVYNLFLRRREVEIIGKIAV